MRADNVEVSWDAAQSKWLVRIGAGEEVIRRRCQVPKDADEPSLLSAVEKIVEDEGYESDPAQMHIRR